MFDKIILGTAQLGMNYGINNYGKLNKDKVFDILDYAFDNNIELLDTAEIYGDALDVIGSFLKANPGKNFKIISKIDPKKKFQNKELIKHIKSNLKILNSNYYYGYMFHSYKTLKKQPEIYLQLQNAKNMGYVKKIGISLYENSEIIDIIKNYSFDFIQTPFNLLDNETKRGEVLKNAKNKNMEIHVRSIFLQGLFFKPYIKFNFKLRPLIKYIKRINTIAKNKNMDVETLSIHYPLKKDYIDKIIFGVHDINQLSKNIQAILKDIEVPNNKIEKINVIEEELLKPFNWN